MRLNEYEQGKGRLIPALDRALSPGGPQRSAFDLTGRELRRQGARQERPPREPQEPRPRRGFG